MKKILFLIILCLSIFVSSKVLAYQEYKVGDVITVHESSYHVIENSDSNQNYVTLMRDDGFSSNEIRLFSVESTSSWYVNPYCWGPDSGDCTSDYNNSSIYSLIDKWMFYIFDDDELVEVNGYKARLINIDELQNLGYEVKPDVSELTYYDSGNVPSWVYDSEKSYWTMSPYEDSLTNVYYFSEEVFKRNVNERSEIRPVINLNKNVIEIKDDNNNGNDKIYDEYRIGDRVQYNGDVYYVISNSDKYSDFLVLLRDKPLDKDDINKNSSIEYLSENGEYPFYLSNGCNSSENMGQCNSNFDNSLVKELLNNWIQNFSDDLVSIDGYKVRLLNLDELLYIFNYQYSSIYGSDYSLFTFPKGGISFINIGKKYWTMASGYNSNSEIFTIYDNGYMGLSNKDVEDRYQGGWKTYESCFVFNSSMVRPVINLKKDALKIDEQSNTDGCYVTTKKMEYKKFNIGDQFEYKGQKYDVIANSNGNTSYVTVLKDTPLTYDEVINAFKTLDIEVSNNIIDSNGMALLNSDYYIYAYSDSLLKEWEKTIFDDNDVVEIGGRTTRLLLDEDLLFNLGYNLLNEVTSFCFSYTSDTPSFMYDVDYEYVVNSNTPTTGMLLRLSRLDKICTPTADYAIRPVVNLNKCVLEDGCREVETVVNKCVEEETEVVNVENTLKSISSIILIFSIFLIAGGGSFIIYNYFLAKKRQ
ncbi:MAG: hypothetical protein IJR82_04295 [Bacilli bacterium]|nr:hypothetical protein [Bacilli bacterium]